MSLADTVASAVAVANQVTAGLQIEVSIEAWIGNTETAAKEYDVAVGYDAIFEQRNDLVRDFNGDEVTSVAKLTILRPIVANGADDRREPFDPRDRVTLPDGEIGVAVKEQALVNPNTGLPYMHEIWLGGRRR